MTNFLDIAKSRYTTKVYQNKKIDQTKIADLKEILRLAPSSINSQPWKFIFISEEETKQILARHSYSNELKINEASHLVVFLVIDDLSLFEEQLRNELGQGQVNYYLKSIKPLGDDFVKNWLSRQVYISLGYFLSACASMNIDSTPMEGIDCAQYDNVLKREGYKTLFAVAMGYRDPQDSNQPSITPKSRIDLHKVIESI